MPTVCLRSSYPFYVVSYYITWVNNSWTYTTYFSYIYIAIIQFINQTLLMILTQYTANFLSYEIGDWGLRCNGRSIYIIFIKSCKRFPKANKQIRFHFDKLYWTLRTISYQVIKAYLVVWKVLSQMVLTSNQAQRYPTPALDRTLE